MKIRAAAVTDAEAIRAIYNHEVMNALTVFEMQPRSLDEQEAWLTERSGAYSAIVATDDDGVVLGFASLSPYRPKPGYKTTVENSVYVDAAARGGGVGRELLNALIGLARDHGFHCVICHISGGNDTSVALHRAAGFQLVGVEREVGRKFGKWLDVTVMQLLL